MIEYIGHVEKGNGLDLCKCAAKFTSVCAIYLVDGIDGEMVTECVVCRATWTSVEWDAFHWASFTERMSR